MWIKITLITLPTLLVTFLLASFFFVPSGAEIAQNADRGNRLIKYLTSDVSDLNPWLSTSATDSDVHDFIFQGLFSSDDNYQLKPELAKKVRVGQEIVIVLNPQDNPEEIKTYLDNKLKMAYPRTFGGFRDYDARNFDTSEEFFGNYGLEGEQQAAQDGAARLVLYFRPDLEQDYEADAMPVGMLQDAPNKLESLLAEKLGNADYVKNYNAFEVAAGWYAKRYGFELPTFDWPEKEEVKSEKQEEYTKLLTQSAQNKEQSAQGFDLYLKSFPEARLQEHPLVHIQLHEKVRWHDYGMEVPDYDEHGRERKDPKTGKPLTRILREELDAKDVVFTFAFGRDEHVNSPRRSSSDSILQFRVHDNLNFDVLYKGLYSPALSDLGMPVLPEHRFSQEEWMAQAIKRGLGPETSGDPNYNVRAALPAKQLDFSKAPIGTGPMKIHFLNGNSLPAWRSGELVRLERFEDFWDPEFKPAYQYMDFYVFDEKLGQETTELVFQGGGLDLYGLRPFQVTDYEKERENYYLYKRLALSYDYFGFNLEREIFQDKRVRQALTMAVDVDKIIRYVRYGQGRRINGPAYPLLDYYDENYIPNYTFRQGVHKGKTLKDAGIKYYPFDLKEAEALLREAGWKKNAQGKLVNTRGEVFKLTFCISGVTSVRGKAAALARENWGKLGVEVELEDKEWNVFLNEHIRPGNFDVVALGWTGGTDYDSRQLWHSDFAPPNGLNFGKYKNPKVDGLFEQILKEYNPEEQVRISHEIFRTIADDCPYIFLYSPYQNVAVRRDLYWNVPLIDNQGKVTGYEKRSVVDPATMVTKKGPGSLYKRLQWKRSKERLFPADEKEVGTVRSEKAFQAYKDKYNK